MNKLNLLKCLLGLFFCIALPHLSLSAQNHKSRKTTVTDSMTVIKIFPAAKGDTVTKVIFQTSQRIYKLHAKAKAIYLKRLKESLNKHIPVPVKRAREESDVIISVGKAKVR